MKRGKLKCKYKIWGKNVRLIPKYLHLRGVEVYKFKLVNENLGIIVIDFKDNNKFFAICKNMCYNKTIMGYSGMFFPIALFLSKIGVCLGVLLFSILSIFLDNFVFDVVITGNGSYYSMQTMKVVEDFGVKKFSKFSDFNLKNLEISILQSNANFSFVSCKKRGNRLIIDCQLSNSENLSQNRLQGDLISSVDGVVESILVIRGTQLVNVGDVVKKGNSLVGAYFLGSEDKVFSTYVLARSTIISTEEYFYKNISFTEENKQDCKNISIFNSENEYISCEFEELNGGILVKLKVRVYINGE